MSLSQLLPVGGRTSGYRALPLGRHKHVSSPGSARHLHAIPGSQYHQQEESVLVLRLLGKTQHGSTDCDCSHFDTEHIILNTGAVSQPEDPGHHPVQPDDSAQGDSARVGCQAASHHLQDNPPVLVVEQLRLRAEHHPGVQ